MKRIIFGVLLSTSLAASSPGTTGELRLDSFSLLDNNDAPPIIAQDQSQDLLNVDITPGGKSIKKRAGYGTYKTLGNGAAVHGGYHFYDSTGNDVLIWGAGTNLYGIVAGGSPTILVSSATTGATWDCADTQGFAYCVDSSRDVLVKTNGATITWSTAALGSMVMVTPDRLIVAGVAASPNTLFVSGSNNFLNFTAGINATDPFTEPIAAPGSKLTHIEYACGRWMWWKDQSFGYILGTDQTNLQVVTVSQTIGTQDNSSAIDPGGNIYFRGQDGHIYQYDCSNFQKLSRDITPYIQSSGQRVANNWPITSQADFQTGVSTPSGSLSFTISPGDVVPSTFSAVETSSSDFANGTISNLDNSSGTYLTLSRNNTNVLNNGFETNSPPDNWTLGANGSKDALDSGTACTITPRTGSAFLGHAFFTSTNYTYQGQLLDCNTDALLSSVSFAQADNSCTWTPRTLSSSGFSGRPVKIKFIDTTDASTAATSDCFINSGTDITFYSASTCGGSSCKVKTVGIDDVTDGRSSILSGFYTSKAFNTGVPTSYAMFNSSVTVNTSTPTFSLMTSSAAAGVWTTIATSTGISVAANQYLRYSSTITVTTSQYAFSTINDVTVFSRSSGTYYSAVHNAPNITSWDTFNVTKLDNGGSHSFFVRSATNTFSVGSSTPAWTAQTIGALMAVSTGTYFQVRDDMSITNSSQTPTLNDFTVNWFEGVASDKAYAIYYNDAIWWAVAYGAGQTSNNYVFHYDLINKGWGIYNIPVAGFLLQNNALYFGSVSNDKIYKFGTSNDDNGSAINAYWKSKDFTGPDPWLQSDLKNLDLIARKNLNQSLSVSYAVNGSTTSTSYTISLSTGTEANIFHRKLLPPGVHGNTVNVQVSDNSTGPAWEVMGIRLGFDQLPYRPSQ